MTALYTLIIFFAPGLLIASALTGRPKLTLTLGEQLYLVFAGSLLVSGWLGLTLAELGHFSPRNVSLAALVIVLVAALAARKHLTLRRGTVEPSELVLVGAMVAFATVVYFPPFEHVLGGRDPGIYVNAGFHLARDGRLEYPDAVAAAIAPEARPLFFPDKELPDWSYERFQGFRLRSPEDPLVVPHGLHLYPVWIGTASGLFQMKSGLYATPFFAMMGVLGLFFAAKRIFGFEVAAWAASLLTVFQIQIWFARFPNSEVVVQFLFALGLLCFWFMDEHRSRLAGALAGFALGSTFLARFETVLLVVPLAAYLGYRRVRRELGAPELYLLGAFAIVAAQAFMHDWLFAWPYVSSIMGRHYWRFIGENIVAFAAGSLLLALLFDRLAPRLPKPLLELPLAPGARLGAAISLFLLALYAYFVRPLWHGPRTAFQDAEAFLRMGWYLYPAGVALAVSGGMLLLTRARKSQAFFLLVALTFSLFFFYKVRVWHDHYFAMRRFVPFILPGFFVAIGVFLASLGSAASRFSTWGARALGAALLVVYTVAGARLWHHDEFHGSIEFVEDLARHIGDDDIVFFPRQEGLHLLELPLAHMEGRNVLEFYTLKPDRRLLESLLAGWREHDRFRDVYFITNYKISLSGLFTRHVQDFWLATEKYEYGYTRPSKGPEPFHLRFTLSKAVDLDDLASRVPALTRLDVGGSDDPQVAWFHEKELEEDGTSYRWSQRVSSIFLPGLGEVSRRLVVRLAGPKEDDAPLNPVEVALDGVPVATLEPGRSYRDFEVTLPPQRARDYGVLTLSTPTWRPANDLVGAEDVRDLGVRVDWLELR